MKLEAALPRNVRGWPSRVPCVGLRPLFGAIGRLALPAPVRLSDFVNEQEGFLRLTDVEFLGHDDITPSPDLGPTAEHLINKTGIELICQPAEDAIERGSQLDEEYGKSLQIHTHRFTVSAYLHLAHEATLDAVLSYLALKFIPVTNASARFIGVPASRSLSTASSCWSIAHNSLGGGAPWCPPLLRRGIW